MEKNWNQRSKKYKDIYLAQLGGLYGEKRVTHTDTTQKEQSSKIALIAKVKLPTEADEQTKLVVWMKKQGLRPIVSANGGSRHYLEAAKLKRTGVSPGVPDIFLPIASGIYNGLFIELKRIKGGKTSPEQLSWLQYLRDQGYYAEVCNGCEAAKELINWYLALTYPAA